MIKPLVKPCLTINVSFIFCIISFFLDGKIISSHGVDSGDDVGKPVAVASPLAEPVGSGAPPSTTKAGVKEVLQKKIAGNFT